MEGARMSNVYWRLLPLLLIALVGVVIWQNRLQQAVPAQRLACADLARGCTTTLAGRPLELGMQGEMTPLTPIPIWLKATGVRKVEARFTMEGMNMGFNLYTLRPDANGVFRASVTLPVCVSGKRDWVMTLDIDGALLSVPFSTAL